MTDFNDMMRKIIATQQNMLGMMYENSKTPFDFFKDYKAFVDNSINFHNGAIKYHESIVEMLSAMKNITEIYKIKP